MRKILIALSFGLAVQSYGASIIGSDHDLSALTGAGPCAVCHTPHNSLSGGQLPLWVRTLPTTTYVLYASPTARVTAQQPNLYTRMCLSCHDGTLALDTIANNKGSHFIDKEKSLGTDLSDDHPVSVQFLGNSAFKDMVTPVSAKAVDASGTIPLFSGMIECASCHSVHDSTFGNFLRVDNSKSQLCRQCHLK